MKNSLSDIALITQVVVFHNNRAFDSLVRKYQSGVRRFLLHLTLGNEALSDDLAQETFIRAFERLSTFGNRASFQTWLFRIAYHIFYDYIRRRKTIEMPDDQAVEQLLQPTTPHNDIQWDIHSALATLRPAERTCLTLHLMEDLTVERISLIIDMPEGTVKMHLTKGRKKLASYLKEHGYGNK